MASDPGTQKTIIVGAGPVGALAALYAAKRGHQVEVYELRGDLRDPSTTPLNFTKSINLAMSERGINALRRAEVTGLEDAVLNETIPMYGRMIHGIKNDQLFGDAQLYDVHGRYQRAADRGGLNKTLLDQLESMRNVKLLFSYKLISADFKRNLAWFEKRDDVQGTTEIEVSFDFLIGADGAHSAVRYHLMKYTQMFYQQEYIDTLWCEFHIAPSTKNTFKLPENYLHIWPGIEFMFIAIPSMDNTFTSTLFLPKSRFAELDAEPSSLVPFFKEHFPGVIPDLISEEDLHKQYNENSHLPLISVKCTPYHFGSSGVILGDAAHAMVPFYGQGMNAGLEDVRVLFDFIDRYPSDRAKALEEYTRQRTPDAHAINDLALRNYQEMRSDVRSPIYLFRKKIEEGLDKWIPGLGWKTQYSRISFGNARYSEVEKSAKRQGKILLGVLGVALVSALSSGTVWASRLVKVTSASPERNWISIWGHHLIGKIQILGRKLSW